MIKVYRKTATIKAEQFDGTKETAERLGLFRYRGGWYLETLEGSMIVSNGYWIATGVNGEHWPIADDIFNKTYAELPVIPKYVADYIDMLKNSTDVVTASIGALEYGWGEIELINWIDENGDTFARAWLDGYTVEYTLSGGD